VLILLMFKCTVSIIVASFLTLSLNGCGGSSSVSGSSGGAAGGAPLSQYQATLPDGSLMELEILGNDNLGWSGEFAVAATVGPYAFEVGSFEGSIVGGVASATCEASDGTVFQLNGTVNGDASLSLTRSDTPGLLNFTPVLQQGPTGRATTSFNLNSNGSNGRVSLSTTPYSVQGGTMTEYRGTWLGLNVTFWSYSNGYATLVTYINDFAINTASFSSYKLTDFGTLNVTSSSGQIAVYSAVTKSQFKYKTVSQVSP
jgi:hypothetical protein